MCLYRYCSWFNKNVFEGDGGLHVAPPLLYRKVSKEIGVLAWLE